MNEDENKIDTPVENVVNEEVKVESTPDTETTFNDVKEEKKSKPIKNILFILIPILIIVFITVLIFSLIPNPAKTVKNFVNGYNNLNAEKVVKQMDYIGMSAFPYSYSDDFEQEDYDEFLESYDKIEKKNAEDKDYNHDDELEEIIDTLDSSFYDLKKDMKKFKIKLEEIKSSEKLFDDLYLVKAKISLLSVPKDDSDEEVDSSEIMSFYIYNNKIVKSDLDF